MNVREKMDSGGYAHKLPWPMADAKGDYQSARKAWREEEHQINMQFKADLEEEFGTQGWDRKEQAWNLAWQEGHSAGFSEVLNYYLDYVEAFFK